MNTSTAVAVPALPIPLSWARKILEKLSRGEISPDSRDVEVAKQAIESHKGKGLWSKDDN